MAGRIFYAKDVDGLKREGEISLRVDPVTHEAAAIAAAHGQSLNQWATEAIRQAALAG